MEQAFNYRHAPLFTNLSFKVQCYTHTRNIRTEGSNSFEVSTQQLSWNNGALLPGAGPLSRIFVNPFEIYQRLSAGVRWSSVYLKPMKVALA